MGAESKNFITCPHIWTLNWEKNPDAYSAGDLFVVTDHANISASSPGIGPNIDEYGPRFYDIANMYDPKLTEIITNSVQESSPDAKICKGDLFWINNSAVPSLPLANLAAGLSNNRVCFKGAVKTGISELMSIHHRKS